MKQLTDIEKDFIVKVLELVGEKAETIRFQDMCVKISDKLKPERKTRVSEYYKYELKRLAKLDKLREQLGSDMYEQ